MLSEKRFLTRFFFAHLCLIVPIVVVGVLAVSIMLDRIEKQGEQTIMNRLNTLKTSYTEDWIDYQQQSVLLSAKQELLPYKITGDMKDTYEGIKQLELKRYYGSDVTWIFADYENEYLYTSGGRFRKENFFKRGLQCREESYTRGMGMMENTEDSVTFLFHTDTVGYMVYGYPIRRSQNEYVSFYFAFTLEQVMDMLPLFDENQWYRLEAEDGSVLAVGCDASGRNYVLSPLESQARMDSGQYFMAEDTIDVMGIKISLYCRESAIKRESTLYQMQWISMSLMIVGILLSAMISWFLSRHRMDEIMRLESLARGELDYSFTKNDAYSSLQNIIVSGMNEVKELKMHLSENDHLLRSRSAGAIFKGMINNPDNINEIFREFGLKGCPDVFFVCIVSATTQLTEKLLPLLKSNLWVPYHSETAEGVVFLYELKNNDSNRIQRKKLGEDIRKQLHQQGVRKVRIGVSKVFTDSLMIDCAYKQAVSALENVVSGDTKEFCGFWESIAQDSYFVLPDKNVLEKFSDALSKQDFGEAARCFYNLIENASMKECTSENQLYIRYAVLQRLVDYLNSADMAEKKKLLNECLNVRVMAEGEFKQDIIGILKQCLIEEEDDHLTKMQKYIEKNYSRSSLTYEEVAEAGGVTKTYVSKIFRTKLGVSYIEYLTEVRLNQARILLQTTDYSINDIVKMVGYENASSFRRYFKKKYGIKATDYRKEERELGEEDFLDRMNDK